MSKGKDLCKLIDVDMQDRQHVMQRRRLGRDLYHGNPPTSPSLPGGSNIMLPIVEEKVEGMVPKLVNAFWGAEPTVNVRRTGEEFDKMATRNVEQFLNWAIEADIDNFYETVETWFRNTVLDGLSVLKVYWHRKERNSLQILTSPILWKQGQVDFTGQLVETDRPRTVLEGLVGAFEGLQEAEGDVGDDTPIADAVGSMWTISFIEDRRLIEDVTVQIVESEYVDEVELYVYRPIVVANKPCVEVVEYEDIILPYRTWDLQSAERVTQRYWLTFDEVKRIAAEDNWDLDEADWDKLKSATKTEDRHERDDDDKFLARQRDYIAGEQADPNGSSSLDNDEAPYVDGKLLMYEVYTTDDMNGDGQLEEVIYHIPACLEKIVKANYLEEIFPHGRRPFIDAHYIRQSDRWYSRSLAEQLVPIALEVNAIVNMVNEGQELINNPFFFYVPHANTVEPEVLENIEPGQGIPVSDINAIMFPKFPQEPLANLSAVDSMLLFADRLTIAPQAVGSNQTRNAPRTARGTLALLSEAGIKTDIIITGFQKRPWPELFHQIHALYMRYGDPEKFYRVTGEENPKRITPSEMRGRFEFTFSGNSVNTNREVMRSIAQMRYTTLMANPLYAMDLNAMLAVTEDFLHHYHEGADVSSLLPRLPGAGGSHPPMDQHTENRIMSNGVPIDALPTDDHVSHIRELESFTKSAAFDQLPEAAVALLANHMRQHQQFLQQTAMQQGGPIPAGAGMANNVPTGLTAGGGPDQSDLGALEGGIQ